MPVGPRSPSTPATPDATPRGSLPDKPRSRCQGQCRSEPTRISREPDSLLYFVDLWTIFGGPTATDKAQAPERACSAFSRNTAAPALEPSGYRPPVNGASPSFIGRNRSADHTSSTATCPIGRRPYSPAIGQTLSRLIS